MIPYVILGSVLALPLLLGILFRVSSSHLFFSLMAGELLARYFGPDVGNAVYAVANNHLIAEYAELSVIVLPMVLTAIFLRKTVTHGKLILHIIPLVITGLVLAAFFLPELPFAAKEQVQSVQVGNQLLGTSTAIIGGVVILQLVVLWLLHQPHDKHKKHHK